jgi:8-oxo-dGTP diphosphatase
MVTSVRPPEQVVIDTPWVAQWRPEFIGTLLFVLDQEQVLLIHKKTGHGAGKVNAPGGKLEPGESVIDCACREVFEEVGLIVRDPVVGAELRFVERNGPQWLGFALTATDFSGDLRETVEANPFWCPLAEIPYAQMWPDDAIWLPRLLAEPGPSDNHQAPIVGNFLFDNQQLLSHEFDGSESLWSTLGRSKS